jgi:hypothetical protein
MPLGLLSLEESGPYLEWVEPGRTSHGPRKRAGCGNVVIPFSLELSLAWGLTAGELILLLSGKYSSCMRVIRLGEVMGNSREVLAEPK